MFPAAGRQFAGSPLDRFSSRRAKAEVLNGCELLSMGLDDRATR